MGTCGKTSHGGLCDYKSSKDNMRSLKLKSFADKKRWYSFCNRLKRNVCHIIWDEESIVF